MKQPIRLALFGFLGALVALSFAAMTAGGPGGGAIYAVTVTNLTPAQIFSPILVATHQESVSLFRPGAPASRELALLAEEGDNSVLLSTLMGAAGVTDVASGGGVVMPGTSQTVQVAADASTRTLSLAGMLVSTNDTFVGLSMRLPDKVYTVTTAVAYDAGTEYNSESCEWVPGPPCGAAGMHDPTPAEGFISVSNGIHDRADVASAEYDWRNPVARVTIRRLP